MEQDAYQVGILTGLISGVLITALVELLRFMIVNKEALVSLLSKGSRRYSHISGKWYQYHLTIDESESSKGPVIWVSHVDDIAVTILLRVRGQSVNQYKTRLNYKITGRIDKDRLLVTYVNVLTDELAVTVVVDNILSNDIIQGVWSGYNFDKRLTTGPIIYSRKELNEDNLDAMMESRRDIIIGTRRRPGMTSVF